MSSKVASGEFLGLSLWGIEKAVEAPNSVLFVSLIFPLTLLSDTPVCCLCYFHSYVLHCNSWSSLLHILIYITYNFS
jgi:hypothetical protein